ncbi:MAG: hypothetical protein HY925_04075, partial [Elusimicrobia bacterium]|nr:hypothetical protein [Elusimicrobiota bacterium]
MSRPSPRRVPLSVRHFDAAAAYAALARGSRRAFLLERCGWAGEPESACIGWGPRAIVRLDGGKLKAEGLKLPKGDNPVDALGKAIEGLGRASSGPAWAGGAIGYLAYEAAGHLEPVERRRELREEGLVMIFDEALIHDYRTKKTEFVSWRGPATAKAEAAARALRARPTLARVNGSGSLAWPPKGALGK